MTATPEYLDPLQLRRPTFGEPMPHTYWEATAGPAPADDGVLTSDADCDVAVIGGGYTGLSCAYHLRKLGAGSVMVLEANRAGWGCSGRNGSFARPAIGRVPYTKWQSRWGDETARAMFAEALAALRTTDELITEAGIQCDRMPDGWLKIAHRPEAVNNLRREADVLREAFAQEVEFLDSERLAAEHVRGREAFGALRWSDSFAMHPLKLSHGLLRAAREKGAGIFSGTPAFKLDKERDKHVITTHAGRVRARHVVMATNGYTVDRLFSRLRGRLLPVLSNIVVTQPLSTAELDEGNFRTTDCMSDTRALLYYFRRLPDNRILMGGKGPVRCTSAGMLAHQQELLQVVRRKFPFVGEPRADYFWGGWVALTLDSIPHVTTAEDDPTFHYALGYVGSGVSCSIHAGRHIAERIAGRAPRLPDPLSAPLKRFPFAAFRRLGQAAAMRWHAYRDEVRN